MPKKRNTYWSRNKKEKQILTARLIEISIKVEDCIYKQKPISICEAEQYMREVSSYKTLCSRDERSLQVIEKLTRCMKAIISDHQELRSDNLTINNGSPIAEVARAGSISPVYSIPDEDRTQLTQRPENDTESNTDVEVIDLCNIDDDDLMHNGTDTALTNHASSRITVEVDIHRAMSSLSLKDGEDQLDMTPTDVNCSQSILKEFQGVGEVQQTEITSQEAVGDELVGSITDIGKTKNVIDAGDKNDNNTSAHDKTAGFAVKPDKKSKTNSVTKELNIVANSKNNVNFKTVLQKPLEVINTTKYGLTDTYYHKDNTISSKSCYPATNISEGQTWYDSNRTCTINDSSHTLNVNYTTQPAPITVKIAANLDVNATNNFNKVENIEQPSSVIETSKTLINNTSIGKENSTKKKRGPRKKKVIDENEIKPKNKRVYRVPKSKKEKTVTKSTKNKIIPIYNENVINDLSWVENIRFVREITIDENDPTLNLEDSFWDNYYLPANWSDNEFV